MNETTASHQFAEDYILVTENDFATYTHITETAEFQAGNMSGLSDKLKSEFEDYIGQVVEREREQGHEIGALLIAQMLNNWGANSFDIIARHYLALKTGE